MVVNGLFENAPEGVASSEYQNYGLPTEAKQKVTLTFEETDKQLFEVDNWGYASEVYLPIDNIYELEMNGGDFRLFFWADDTEYPEKEIIESLVPAEGGEVDEWIEGEDERVIKNGNFTTDTNSQGHGGAHIGSDDEGAYVEYTFTGSKIEVYTKSGPGAGIAEILLDGEKVAEDDQYTESAEFMRKVFVKDFGKNEKHTIRVLRTGRTSGSGTFFNFDAFRVFRKEDVEPPVLSWTILDDAIRAAEELDRELYTEESLAKLDELVAAGRTLKSAEDVTQDQIDEAALNINNQIDALEFHPVEPETDKQALQEKYDELKNTKTQARMRLTMP